MAGCRISLVLLAFGAAGWCRAQAASPSGAPASPAPGLTSAPAAGSGSAANGPVDDQNQPRSSYLAAMLAAGMPKYSPPKPPPKNPEAGVDLRTIDRPKNEIIRLPKFVVHGERPPVFRERDLYTKSGLAELEMSRYGGLNIGPLSPLNAPIAEQMYRDDERLKNIADLKDTAAAMQRGGDAAESAYILRASDDTYMSASRSFDWGAPAPQNPSAGGPPGIP